MKVGGYYGFEKTFKNPETQYPHKNNDIVVKNKVRSGGSDPMENR